MITKVINVNLHQPIYERLTAKQGDIASRYLLFHLLDGDKPFDLSNRTVRVYAIKPDKTEIFNDLTINDASKGYCTLELTSQCLSEAGIVKMELYISESGKVLTSIPFELEVIACINTANGVTSTNEFSALEVALSSLQDYNNLRREIIQARKGHATVGKRLDDMANELTIRNVTNYGVVANSDVPQNVKINELLSTYTNTHLYFPKGRYVIDDSLIVFENTTIELHKDAEIEFKAGTITAENKINPNLHTGKHIFKNDLTNGLKNIEIFGGKIIGNGKTQVQDAQRCFRFENVKNLKVHNMTIEEVSGWIFCYVNIDGFHFHDLRFKQPSAEKYGVNGDGVSGVGRNGVIENIYGYVSDDLVSIHTGETSIAKNLDSENILIRNIYAEPLVYEENGQEITEYCFRPFAFYNFNNRTSKNITVDGIYGISKTPLRIVCDGWENDTMLQNCEIKNIYVEVKPFASSNLYDKCAFTIRNLRCSSIKFNNINVTYDGVEQLYGMFIDNSKIDNLFIQNSGFENVNGNSPVILDRSSIANVRLDNIKVENTKGTGLLYYKSYLNDKITKFIADNIYGNLDNLIGHEANAIVEVQRRFSTKDRYVGIGEIGSISLTASQNVYEQYKIINVLGNSVKINLQPSTEENGYYFLLNVGDYTDTKLYSGTDRIFGTTVITKGLYVVARNQDKWNISKLSTSPLVENTQ